MTIYRPTTFTVGPPLAKYVCDQPARPENANKCPPPADADGRVNTTFLTTSLRMPHTGARRLWLKLVEDMA
jgi:hypothetical protein